MYWFQDNAQELESHGLGMPKETQNELPMAVSVKLKETRQLIGYVD